MLAAVRRGPLATPDEFEKIEYLFTRVKKGQAVWRFDRFALEHTLSYQRRVHAIKTNFMVRQQPTPLGPGTETNTHHPSRHLYIELSVCGHDVRAGFARARHPWSFDGGAGVAYTLVSP